VNETDICDVLHAFSPFDADVDADNAYLGAHEAIIFSTVTASVSEHRSGTRSTITPQRARVCQRFSRSEAGLVQ